jgi:hypothetical protein
VKLIARFWGQRRVICGHLEMLLSCHLAARFRQKLRLRVNGRTLLASVELPVDLTEDLRDEVSRTRNVRTRQRGTNLTQNFPNLSGPFRAVLSLVSVLAVIPISLHTAGAGNLPLSAIVVDANSGSVLYTAGPDELRHSASLTKIMTLYLLFERWRRASSKSIPNSRCPSMRRLGGAAQHGRQRPWTLASRPEQSPLCGTLQCPLQIARPTVLDRSALA